MANKALVTWRADARSPMSSAREFAAVDNMGMGVTAEETPGGTLISGSDEQYRALESQGFRVKVLPDTNLLRIGRYTIDVEADAEAPAAERAFSISDAAPDAETPVSAGWTHYLVQLAAPPNDDWVREIESRGVDVVEPVSSYGLFVVGDKATVERLRELTYVVWTGPLKPAYRMMPNADTPVEYLFAGVYPPASANDVIDAIVAMGGQILEQSTQAAAYGGEFVTLTIGGSVSAAEIAILPAVRWVDAVGRMSPTGERETQIVAQNLNGAAPPNTAPVPGYQAWISGVGADGTGVRVAIVDSGVDANANNNNLVAHADLRGRQAAFVDYSGGAGTTDTNGHGTNVAGIALGNAASGQVEAAAPGNFLWGQGVAPGVNFITQNFLDATIAVQPSVQTLVRDSSANAADVMNNSWGVNNNGGDGYVANARVIDLGVRDPNSVTPELEHLAIVSAAGNAGGRPQSIGSPHESKNEIVVGNSLTSRPGSGFPSEDIRGIAGTSGRGPAVDGRILPTLVAPGTNVSAAFSRTATAAAPIPGTGVPDPMNPGTTIDRYTFMTGTSQASPHVAGACAVLTEWWRNRTGGKNPSPAMLKALLVMGANDLAGGENWRCVNRVTIDKSQWSLQSGSVFRRGLYFVPDAVVDGNNMMTQVANAASITAQGQWAFDGPTATLFVRMAGNANPGAGGVNFITARDSNPVAPIPNNDQGWGRVSLTNVLLQSPASLRGPAIYSDQKHAFTAAGQEFQINVAPVDTARPLRITIAWTDAAAAAGANPALVNDLDLEVTEVATGNVYKGNVFVGGFSNTGGLFDVRNNVECVYVQNPTGTYEVRILAATIAASASPAVVTPWQDFALVIDNAEVPAAAPVSVSAVVDRSGSMVFSGYVDNTRISTKQFVDLLSLNDSVGVASFGSTAAVEFPSGGTVVQPITGQSVRDAANAEVDGIAFSGCTFMGAGIEAGGALLSGSSGSRAIVLLSDGYDNKGCDAGNPAKPSALDAASALAPGIRLYSCAMGPASDQTLLEQLAAAADGRYYYMPTIDDLFEIYNYIRGQVTGDSIAVNESASASNSVMPAFIDAGASQSTFTVAWADPKIRAVLHPARKPNEVAVRLRDPKGKLVPVHSSYVRTRIGTGYINFKVEEPAPGLWKVEVSTAEQTHVRYTAGVFVRSRFRLVLGLHPLRLKAGNPIRMGAVMLDGGKPFLDFSATARIAQPRLGLKKLLEKFRRDIDRMDVPKLPGGDSLPKDIARLILLYQKLKKEDRLLFEPVASQLRLTKKDRLPINEVQLSYRGLKLPVTTDFLINQLASAKEAGSYAITVVANGAAPGSGERFVRKEQISVVAR